MSVEITGLSAAADTLDEVAAAFDEFGGEETIAAIDRAVLRTALSVEGDAKRLAPVDTGNLRGSLEQRRRKPGTHVVGTAVEYAAHVEYGTRPHVITPDEADVLAFPSPVEAFGEERTIFTQRVQHPGTEAQPYIRPALQRNRSRLVEEIRDEIRALFEEAADGGDL